MRARIEGTTSRPTRFHLLSAKPLLLYQSANRISRRGSTEPWGHRSDVSSRVRSTEAVAEAEPENRARDRAARGREQGVSERSRAHRIRAGPRLRAK